MHLSERETGPPSHDTPPHSFLISIVLTGRNDGYGGDFLTRFFRTLGFNHLQLVSRGIAHEIVFVEWAPPRDRPAAAGRIDREDLSRQEPGRGVFGGSQSAHRFGACRPHLSDHVQPGAARSLGVF